jgi:hypothetical protein
MKTINILGNSQREQWHSVVNMLRQLGGDLTYEGRSQLCDELDRYIDAMEDLNEQTVEETTQTLCDRNGNEPMSFEEQEDLVRLAVRNSAEAFDAIESSDWDDEEDIADFKRLVMPHGNSPERNIAEYWALDTLAREAFCDIIKGVKE